LTAEIIGCPVIGFWCEPFNNEQATEGIERESDFQCFKAHHTVKQLEHTIGIYGNGTEKIIYIYRDPRDIIVSASHYFSVSPRFRGIYYLLKPIPFGLWVYNKFFHTQSYKIDFFSKGLIEGIRKGAWLETPWKNHVEDFLNNRKQVLAIRFEDLKTDPKSKAKEICQFLSIERTDDYWELAIGHQRFEIKKQKYMRQGMNRKASFLRQGESGEWRRVFRKKNIDLIEGNIGEFMSSLGYPLTE